MLRARYAEFIADFRRPGAHVPPLMQLNIKWPGGQKSFDQPKIVIGSCGDVKISGKEGAVVGNPSPILDGVRYVHRYVQFSASMPYWRLEMDGFS